MALSREALSAHGWPEDEIAEWLETAAQVEVDDALGWKQLGVSAETAAWYVDVRPSIADDWLDAGFAIGEMVRCHQSRVTLRLALQWRAAGRSLDETIQWASHGFGPDEAEEWKAQGHDARSAHYQRHAPDPASRWMRSDSGTDSALHEPIDVPDDARDREAELAEMWPHLNDRDNLGELWAGVPRPPR